MQIDLRALQDMHPVLARSTCMEYGYRAALALERRHHRPGVSLSIALEGREDGRTVLQWDSTKGDDKQLDYHRITEDGAEALALAFVHASHGWSVLRRLQRGESADWLLRDNSTQLVALEVGGIDGSFDRRRLAEKRRQVAKTRSASAKWACVVAFGPPILALVAG